MDVYLGKPPRKMNRRSAPRCFIILSMVVAAACRGGSAQAQAPVRVYGPGGPAPAMKEAAAAFQASTGIVVEVTAGPTSDWVAAAKSDADLIFSGAEHMMTDFIRALEPQLLPNSVSPLYVRPSAILVRRGNPQRIQGLRDLLKPGRRVIVVNGAGQVGLWEDLVGQLGDVRAVRALRQNIAHFASSSAEAQALWNSRPEVDAWIVWNVWSSKGRTPAEVVPVERDLRIYRDTGIAFTRRGTRSESARFAAFLSSDKARAIFASHGWVEQAGQ
jgi:accessory colonization factor AcfC